MFDRLLFAAACASLVLAGCQPRQPVAPPPPAPVPAPPPVDPVAGERERDAEAHRSWEEGTALGRQGRWGEAEVRYRRAAALRPDSATYHLALADALLQQGKEDGGADALLAGIRVEERKQPPNHRVLAVDYERLIQLLTRLNRLDEARTARERQRFHRMMRDASPRR
jgi:tetratricopeptide (TPR) repeat protein